uniref:Protein SirB1 N-terminal domain-containing protein n=1 Tax=Noccaea caerulescens TaxID=107243 RepID=A0A1J3IW81_NOCCA
MFTLLGSASAMTMASSSPVSRFVGFGDPTTLRYDHDQRRRCSWNGIEKKRITFPRNRTASSASAYPLFLNQLNKDSPGRKTYKEVTKPARQMFAREISPQSKDSEISIAKVLLYIAAEDESFLAFNRELDAQSFLRDLSDPSKTDSEVRESVQDQSDPNETDSYEELLQLDGKSISEWLSELDAISKEVEAELVSRDIGCHSVQVLEAVNTVLFDLRGFKRTSIPLDPKYFYLHSVLNCRCGTAFLVSVIYIEVCQRLGVPIVGSRVGEDFLIWPKTEYPEELFNTTSGQSLFGIVNGRCVDDPRSMASDLTGKSLLDLDIATNRDIIGIALANLIRVHWRRASRSSPGLMLTSPIRQLNKIRIYDIPLRPQDLRLAIAAAERLLILEPRNWKLRRDLGMMLYYIKQYGEAIQELSISMAFASNEEEVKVMKLFVEKLHLLRLISSLKSPVNGSDRLTVP